MSQWGQALIALGFLAIVFAAGYGARAALSLLRRKRRMFSQGGGRLFYAGRRIAVAEADEPGAVVAASLDQERLARDVERLDRHVEELQAVFAGQRALCDAARGDLAAAADRFEASVEQTRALTASVNERLDAALRLQVDLEQMMVRLRKRAKSGDEAVLPFKTRQRRLSERK